MRYNTSAVVYVVVVIVVAHAVAPASYSWRERTISELAAQGYERAWIMRAGFIGFGALVLAGALQRLRVQRSTGYRDLPLLLYGAAMLLAGVFSTRSWVATVAYAPAEANLHSVMAGLAGVGITMAVLLCWLRDPWSRGGTWHFLALLLIVGLSAAFGMATRGAGLVQRALYLVGFGWLIYAELPPVAEKPVSRLFGRF